MKSSRRLKNNSKKRMHSYVIKPSYGINQGRHSRSKIESYRSKFKSTREGHSRSNQDQWLMWKFYSGQQRRFSRDTFCMRPCTYSSLGEMLGLHFALYFAQIMLPYATFSYIKTHFYYLSLSTSQNHAPTGILMFLINFYDLMCF